MIELNNQEHLLHCTAEGGLGDILEMIIATDIDINSLDEVN